MTTPRKATVTTKATPLWANETGDQLLLVNRDLVTTVYVSDDTVSTDTGLPIPPLGSVNVTADHQWWGITAAGSAVVWAAPGAANYTPSPAETAAQIASAPIPVEGTQVNQSVASGAKAGVVNTSSSFAGTVTTTVVSAGTKSVELHALVVEVTTTANGQSVRLTRSDTGADLMPQQTATGEFRKDYQGASLPAGVNVQSVCTSPGGATVTAVVDLNYTLIG